MHTMNRQLLNAGNAADRSLQAHCHRLTVSLTVTLVTGGHSHTVTVQTVQESQTGDHTDRGPRRTLGTTESAHVNRSLSAGRWTMQMLQLRVLRF